MRCGIQGIPSDRTWGAEYPGVAPQLRILCEKGMFTASTEQGDGLFYLNDGQEEDEILKAIKAEIARHGGPVFIGIPMEGE